MMMGFFSERGIEIVIAAAAVSVVALIGGLMTEVGPWYEGLRFPSASPAQLAFRARLDSHLHPDRRRRRHRLGERRGAGCPVRLIVLFRDQRRSEPLVEPALLQA